MRHVLGLIGYPLSHSFSPGYFAVKFGDLGIVDATYDAMPLIEIGEVAALLSSDITGLNVTIPYKEAVIPYLDEITSEAMQIGAVNTIDIRDGRSVGHNTDVYGFGQSLSVQLGDVKVERALILGTGGAAKSVKFVLDEMGVEHSSVSRTGGDLLYSDLTKQIVSKHKLIVNTTPLGMYPQTENCPDIIYDAIGDEHFLYDLVYNPEKTLFLKNGESQGASIKNGFDMLILQAEKSWEIWNQK